MYDYYEEYTMDPHDDEEQIYDPHDPFDGGEYEEDYYGDDNSYGDY